MHEAWPSSVWLCPDGHISQLLEGGVVECFPAGQVEHTSPLDRSSVMLVNCPHRQTSDEVFAAGADVGAAGENVGDGGCADASMAPKMSMWAARRGDAAWDILWCRRWCRRRCRHRVRF